LEAENVFSVISVGE